MQIGTINEKLHTLELKFEDGKYEDMKKYFIGQAFITF